MLDMLNNAHNLGKRLWAILAVTLLMFLPPILVLSAALFGNADDKDSKANAEALNCAKFSHLNRLNDLPTSTILAPIDLGPAILAYSPHNVTATGHHRGHVQMRETMDMWRAKPATAQKLLAEKHIGYIVTCATLDEMVIYRKDAPNGLAAVLMSDNQAQTPPKWLEKMPQSDNILSIWKVKHAQK